MEISQEDKRFAEKFLAKCTPDKINRLKLTTGALILLGVVACFVPWNLWLPDKAARLMQAVGGFCLFCGIMSAFETRFMILCAYFNNQMIRDNSEHK